jgi:hypothetical protein
MMLDQHSAEKNDDVDAAIDLEENHPVFGHNSASEHLAEGTESTASNEAATPTSPKKTIKKKKNAKTTVVVEPRKDPRLIAGMAAFMLVVTILLIILVVRVSNVEEELGSIKNTQDSPFTTDDGFSSSSGNSNKQPPAPAGISDYAFEILVAFNPALPKQQECRGDCRAHGDEPSILAVLYSDRDWACDLSEINQSW